MTLLVLALQVWTLLFVGFFGSELLGSYPVLRIAAQLLFVAPLLVWAALRLRGPGDRLGWAVLVALGALLLVSFFSADVQGSLGSVGLALAYALTFFAMRELGTVPRLRTAMAIAASIGLVFWLAMTAIWWIQEKVAWVSVFGSMPDIESAQVFIWGTTNVFPILSLLCVPLLRWQPPGPGRRGLVIVWAVASVVVIPLSNGRAGWVGMVVALVVYDWLSGWRWAGGVARWLRERRALIPAGVVALLALVAVTQYVATRFDALMAAALDGRGPIWQQAVAIFLGDPLTGGGPSTYPWLRLTHVPAYTDPIQVRLAHDVPLLTLADGGLILFIAFASLLMVFAIAARSHLADAQRRTAFAVLVGFAAASLFDDFSSLPAVMAVVVTLAAWTVPPETSLAPAGRRRFPLAAALAVVAVAVVIPVVGVDRARVAAAAGREAAVRGDWEAASQQFSEATDAYPSNAGYWLGLGLALSERGSTTAKLAYEQARLLSPGDPRPYGALAALTSDRDGKIRLLDAAARRTISDPRYAFALGGQLDAAGRHAEAIQAYAIAVILDRQLMHQFGPDGAIAAGGEVLDEIGRIVDTLAPQAGLSSDGVRWDLDLLGGGFDQSLGLPWQAVSLAAHGNAAEARAAAADALRSAPYDRSALRAAQAVARMTCDRDRYDALTSVLGPFRPELPSQLTIVREHVYREDALSSYDPPDSLVLPEPDRPWPWSLIGNPQGCPDWPDAP